MVEGRASKYYKNFIETFIYYQALFDNAGDLTSILQLPYPLYKDIILAQVEEKKKEKRRVDEQQGRLRGSSYHPGQTVRPPVKMG